MRARTPSVVVLAGPNGTGKTTSAPALLKGALGVGEFVNPDLIAQGLSGFDPDSVALAASRIMLERLHELGKTRASFAFETTLASRTYAPWLGELATTGYKVRLVFLWLPSVALAVARVAGRVRMGGHSVPEHTILRRYHAGLRNFFDLYQPLAFMWRVYDNSGAEPRLVATGSGTKTRTIIDREKWRRIANENP